jgi:D-inositol-3-phosphate glycosyltransferase
MAGRGVEVDIFTRRSAADQPDVVEVAERYRVRHVTAGPPQVLSIRELQRWIGIFGEGVIAEVRKAPLPDVVHSHYWLSGWAGVLVKEAIVRPLANSFHTLGRIKDMSRRPGEPGSNPMRTMTEEEVIARSDCVIASTPFEFDDLLDHYGAAPERLCTSPPGVDHAVFRPGDQATARGTLGLPDGPLILFAGRIQALKGLDVAIGALAQMDHEADFVIVGGPSGTAGEAELEHLRALADGLGIRHRIHLIAPQPHARLAQFYQAADVLVMPSRSETFGLVAAEAQACGLPVVASRIGGLPYVVDNGETGILVEVGDEPGFAAAMDRVIGDSIFRKSLRAGALEKATAFSWQATADRLLELYDGISSRGVEPA